MGYGGKLHAMQLSENQNVDIKSSISLILRMTPCSQSALYTEREWYPVPFCYRAFLNRDNLRNILDWPMSFLREEVCPPGFCSARHAFPGFSTLF